MRSVTFGLLALAVLLAVPAPAFPLEAPGARPTGPSQPASGPGGTEYVFPAVRATSLGDEPGGGRIFEPSATARDGTAAPSELLPLVLLIDGCCYRAEGRAVNGGGGDGGQGFHAWIEHLVRRGAIVVYPIYGSSNPQMDIAAAMQAALATLATEGHTQPDPARTAVIGFSFGGPLAADYAAAAGAAGLPVPEVLLAYAPSRVYPTPHRPSPPPTLRALVIIGDNDPGAAPGANVIWAWLAPLPRGQRDFVTLVSDDRGEPPLIAVHHVPLTNARPPNPVVSLDALDWYGTWKLIDALMSCTIAGAWCEYALGNTPEQRFMGTWSDGAPVKELVVSDDPASP